jgi:acyl carrier protein
MTTFDRGAVLDTLRGVLKDTLQLGQRSAALQETSPLLGSIAELDSMAVVTVMTALEERFGFVIADDEISADTFATLRSLADFVESKIANG